MKELHPVIKKLNFKNQGQSVLVINAPKSYDEVSVSFDGDVHNVAKNETYEFVQVFGTSNEELSTLAKSAV